MGNEQVPQIAQYIPVLILLVVAIGFAAGVLVLSVLVGFRSKHNRAKDTAYECGKDPIGEGTPRFSVKFYLVAILFILFDVEAIFLYPWAFIFRSLHWFGFVEMILYIGILLVGYFYLWKKGALDWNRPAARRDRTS